MRIALASVLLSTALLAACGEHGSSEGPRLPDNAMPVSVQAAEGTSYDLRCRFKAVTLPGNGMINSINLSGTGPRDGAIPTDNARCTLKQTGGSGPVTATVTKQGATAATATAAPGATATLQVL